MNALGQFVYYRTYSRYIPEKGRRETWKETVARATEYNVGLGVKHVEKIGYKPDYNEWQDEAEALFDSMFNLRQFLSGRTLWVGGADGGVAEKYPLSNFNCSFVNIRSWSDFGDMFYLLLVGTGVGFKCTKEFAEGLAPIRTDIKIEHAPFTQRYPLTKEANTSVHLINSGTKAVIHVGDSKEGWVESIRQFFDILTDHAYANVKELAIYYDYIRPKGARLNTFGGTASGYEPLRDMFIGIERVIKNEIDPSLAPLETVPMSKVSHGHIRKVKVRPVHVLDIGNLIGNNVVVGGVRRTAEIFLFDADDYESMLAKYGINGIWNEEQHRKVIAGLRNIGLDKQAEFLESLTLFDATARPQFHRRMSNNSVAFEQQPPKAVLDLVFDIMQAEGEPGFINLEEAKRRRPNAEGLNPCAEILLDSYGVCNLTTINVVQFVENGKLNYKSLMKAQQLSARAGLRMTLVELEIPHWNAIQQRDRLLGLSLTGVKDAMDLLNYDSISEGRLLNDLLAEGRAEADNYAKKMRVSAPLLTTTVKPEGTISQVAGGVSSGLHYSHAPYYIRRIRINANDPLAKAVQSLGWRIHAEVGTLGYNEESDLAKPEAIAAASTLVIDFPVASGSKRTKSDVDVAEQLANYFTYQSKYTEHNASNTISVKPHEWQQASDIVYDNWDDFVGVSFLADDGGSYRLAPYEACDKATYDELVASMRALKPSTLMIYDTSAGSDLDGADGCEGGVCPVR